MSFLLNCSNLSKSHGSRTLLEGISLSILEGERIGVIGPNGAGKSTLMKLFAGLDSPDSGDIKRRKGLRLGYLPQEDCFPEGSSLRSVLEQAVELEDIDDSERSARIGQVRSIVGLGELEAPVSSLSGGWKKRLAIARELLKQPELLLLDEPTNHLDFEAISWLERFIKTADCSFLIVSHDRVLLENVTSRIIEVNQLYPQGFFSVDGNFSRFLEKRAEHLEAINSYEESLRNKVRREIEWLRRGPKARSTKAKARIQEAGRLIEELNDYKARSAQQGTAGIEFLESGRKTKKLISVEGVSKFFGDRKIFQDLSFQLIPGMCLGIVGANGSGKSTLLNILTNKLAADSGHVIQAPKLQIVKFEQARDSLDRSVSLRRAIAPDGDAVQFRGSSVHVAAWAKRFLFRSEQLETPVSSLSGGEQARLLIAKLMLLPADVLLLDEPTNDLDIDTLEVLEESLEEFPGALVLVTHDRLMLDRVSTTILALDGQGNFCFVADYAQAEQFIRSSQAEHKALKTDSISEPETKPEKGLSYKEQKELNSTETKISKVEQLIAQYQQDLAKPENMQCPEKISELCQMLQQAEADLEMLIKKWEELERKR